MEMQGGNAREDRRAGKVVPAAQRDGCPRLALYIREEAATREGCSKRWRKVVDADVLENVLQAADVDALGKPQAGHACAARTTKCNCKSTLWKM